MAARSIFARYGNYSEPTKVTAVSYVKRMRGAAQSHLLWCSDRNLYVVKFRNNPQHKRVLFNEMFATSLARQIALPVPPSAIVEVTDSFIRNTPELFMTTGKESKHIPCEVGLHFGSQYVLSGKQGAIVDWLPSSMFSNLANIRDFTGALVFDKWVCNTDNRQAVFSKVQGDTSYRATFIDFGCCFNCGDWGFPDHPARGLFVRTVVYAGIRGPLWFAPWILQVEKMPEEYIWKAAFDVPCQWYDSDHSAVIKLVAGLIARREEVRELLQACYKHETSVFPAWNETRRARLPLLDADAANRDITAKRIKVLRHAKAKAV